MMNTHHQHQKQHQHQLHQDVSSSSHSRFAFGKNNRSQSLRTFYIPPSLTRLPNSIADVSHQAVSNTVEDTINSTQALMRRRQSTGGSCGDSASDTSCNNIFSLTPAFPSPSPSQLQQVIPIATTVTATTTATNEKRLPQMK